MKLKYVVINNNDAEEYLNDVGKQKLRKTLEYIGAMREQEGKPRYNNYLVVNIDEPYAGQVADLIEAEERRKGTWDHGDKTMREVMGIAQQ